MKWGVKWTGMKGGVKIYRTAHSSRCPREMQGLSSEAQRQGHGVQIKYIQKQLQAKV